MEAFNGPLGKLLSKNVWEKPIGTFEVIPVEDFPRLPAIVLKGLNNDAKTLYSRSSYGHFLLDTLGTPDTP